MFKVSETLLRYWEKEFPTLITPRKSGRQIRQYTEENIEQVRLIYHLVKEKGMTLQGGTSDVEDQPDRYRADHGGDQPSESHPGGADDPEAGAGPDHLLIRHPEYGEPSDSLNRRGTKTWGNDVDSRTVVPGCVFVPLRLMGMHRSCLSSDAGDRLDVLHLTQGVAEGLHIFHIEDVKLDLSFKDTLVALDAQFVDVHIELP